MEYLVDYNLTNKDIDDIMRSIDDMDKLEFEYNEDKIRRILSYFISKNINNIKELIINKTHIFYEDYDKLKNIVDNLTIEEIKLINEDVSNFIV